MDEGGIRIPKYIVKILAEKLKVFVEDREKTFKFYPWQIKSTLTTIQKSIHPGIPRRALHHLHETGLADEILKFTEENGNSIRIERVREYLYDSLGIKDINKQFCHGNGCQIVYNESEVFNAVQRTRTFEIRRLVDAIIHQLQQTGKSNQTNNHKQTYNWKKIYSPCPVGKEQMLAHCNYSCCLFHKNGDRDEKEKKIIPKKTGRRKRQNFIKRNIQNIIVPKINAPLKTQDPVRIGKVRNRNYSPVRNGHEIRIPRSKTMVESTTQTNWSLEGRQSENSYDRRVLGLSQSEDSLESESEIYCKSDTLNDASMITEEIASAYQSAPAENRISEHKSKDISSKSFVESTKPSEKTSSHTKSSGSFRSKRVTSEKVLARRTSPESSVEFKHPVSLSHDLLVQASGSQVLWKDPKQFLSSYEIKPKRGSLSRCKTSIIDDSLDGGDSQGKELIDQVQNSREKEMNAPNSKDFVVDQTTVKNGTDNKSVESRNHRLSENGVTAECNQIEKVDNLEHEAEDKKLTDGVEENIGDENQNLSVQNGIHTVEHPESNPIDQVEGCAQGNASNEHSSKTLGIVDIEPGVSSDNETTYSPKSLSECVEDSGSEASSSLKENDNLSLEYSSHWTAEYSSTDVSESEDEDFKKEFLEYKRTLLEEDEGIAASCEDEVSLNNDARIGEMCISANDSSNKKGFLTAFSLQNSNVFEALHNLDENVLEIVDEDGCNMLHLAASKGLHDFVENLLQHGLPINSTTKKGDTALQLAITNNHLVCCQILLKNGASLVTEDGSFDDSCIRASEAISTPVKNLIQNYQRNYQRIQEISEVFNRFGTTKKEISKTFPKNILLFLAELTIETDDESSQRN